MRRVLLNRLWQLVLVALGLSVLIFFLIRLSGDPAGVIGGPDATPEMLQAIRERLGLDDPIYVQFGRFVADLFQLEFGDSFQYRSPAIDLVLGRLPASLLLASLAIGVALFLAIPLGMTAATRPGTWGDRFARWFATLGQSVPHFVLGIFLIFIFGVQLGWFPTFGNEGPRSWILPAVTLSTFIMARQLRLVQAYASEELTLGYVKTMKALGYRSSRVYYRHVLRNVTVPMISLLGIELGTFVGGAVITEAVFSWPGIGRLMVGAVTARDYPIVQAGVFVIGVLVVLINLVVDLLYGFVDPRLRAGGERTE